MAITQGITTSFKSEVLAGLQAMNPTGNTIKMALYTSSANLSPTTTAYITASEITGTNYTAGGITMTIPSGYPTYTGTTGFLTFNTTQWTSATFSVAAGLIYNSTNSNRAIAVLDFGGTFSVSAGTFAVVWPTADSANAIIRIA